MYIEQTRITHDMPQVDKFEAQPILHKIGNKAAQEQF